MATPIPMVLRIDVEPDESQPPAGDRIWDGFVAMSAVIEGLRPRLADRAGRPLTPTWFVRFDPDIERAFGRLDFAVHRHQHEFDRILDHRDPVGIHVHSLRWDPLTSSGYTDYADLAWVTKCLEASVEAFTACFGRAPLHASQGGYFMSETLLDLEAALGIKVDVTVEPGKASTMNDRSLGTHATSGSGDFSRCPRRPYFPSRSAFDRPAESWMQARTILMVPLTSYDYRTALTPWFRRWLPREQRRQKRHEPLNPWKPWPSPRDFWDLAERAADESPESYLAFAFRTEARGTEMHRHTTALLEYLPQHPIARRLSIVDPLSSQIVRLAVPAVPPAEPWIGASAERPRV